MLLRTSRVVVEVLLAALLGAFILLAVSAWRLSSGPLSLSFLTPSIEEALNRRDLPFTVKLGDTVLAWAGWRRPLDIRAVDVRALGVDGGVVASVPQMSISISMSALLRGSVAPSRVELIEPRLRLVRTRRGALQIAVGEAGGLSDTIMSMLKTGLGTAPGSDNLFGRLVRVSIARGRLSIDDRVNGAEWRASRLNLSLVREGPMLRAMYGSDVDVGGRTVTLKGIATYQTKTETTHIETDFAGFRPDLLAEKIPALKSWMTLQQPLAGRLNAEFDAKGTVRTAEFSITGTAGRLMLPDFWAQGLPVKSLSAKGRLQQDPQLLIIDDLALGVGSSSEDGKGPSLTGNGVITWIGDQIALNGEAVVHDMPIADFDRYWPPDMGKSPRSWVTQNMTTGIVGETRVKISARSGDHGNKGMVVESMTGTMRFSGANVHYLRPLPPGTDIDASAEFTRDKFIITLKKGRVEGLRVDSGIFRFTKLDTDNEHAEIELVVRGPLHDAFALLDHPELRYAAGLGVETAGAEGDSATRLVFSFPSYAGLTVDEVQFAAAANLRNVGLRNVALGQDLSDGMLMLRIDRKGLEVKGKAKIGTAPLDIAWYETFEDKPKFRSRYEIKGILGDRERKAVGLDFAPYLTGPVDMDLALLEDRKGRGEVAIKLGLKDAVLALPQQDWTKPAGSDALAWLTLVLQDRSAKHIRSFDVRAPGFALAGSALLPETGRPWRVDFRRFKLGATDVAGAIAARSDGVLDVTLKGPSFDASKFLDFGDDKEDGKPDTELPPLSLNVDIGRVLIGDGLVVDRLRGTAHHGPDGWRSAALDAVLDKGHRIGVRISSTAALRKFDFLSSNGGAALDAFGLFRNIEGGKLRVNAVRDNKASGSPWQGRLRLSDFRIARAPLLARMLVLASLPGIVDTLSGRGITFSRLDMPFVLQKKVLTIVKARSVGPALGLTGSGEINFATDRLKFDGTIIPAYTINSVLGHIPIIGRLLTGQDRTGIFATNYSIEGPRDKATVTVNPLSALAPGFLRDLIGGLLSAGEGAKSPQTPAKPAPEKTLK